MLSPEYYYSSSTTQYFPSRGFPFRASFQTDDILPIFSAITGSHDAPTQNSESRQKKPVTHIVLPAFISWLCHRVDRKNIDTPWYCQFLITIPISSAQTFYRATLLTNRLPLNLNSIVVALFQALLATNEPPP